MTEGGGHSAVGAHQTTRLCARNPHGDVRQVFLHKTVLNSNGCVQVHPAKAGCVHALSQARGRLFSCVLARIGNRCPFNRWLI